MVPGQAVTLAPKTSGYNWPPIHDEPSLRKKLWGRLARKEEHILKGAPVHKCRNKPTHSDYTNKTITILKRNCVECHVFVLQPFFYLLRIFWDLNFELSSYLFV